MGIFREFRTKYRFKNELTEIAGMRRKTPFEGIFPLKGRLTTKSCVFSCFSQTTSCVSTAFVEKLCYDALVDSGARRITATVASSPEPVSAQSRTFTAISFSGSSPSENRHCRASSPPTPSLSRTSTSPRRRDNRSTFSRPSVTDRPGGGPAVPIFSTLPSWSRYDGAAPHM